MQRRFSHVEALELLGPQLGRFGITRLAKQTGLDTLGIPCYAAIRPNSRTLAVHQGKGVDEAAAKVSAIMEAVEFAVAEAPETEITVRSVNELVQAGQRTFIRDQALPRGYEIDDDARLSWVTGECLATKTPVFVPLESAALVPIADHLLPFSRSSNGLGAGFSRHEATVHGLCELIERDASTLWSMRALAKCARTAIAVRDSVDPDIRQCLDRISDAGFAIAVFDLTTDLGLPVVMALLWSGRPQFYFDVASGVCAHPQASRALVGAVQEAAQTRITNIAGARDDIDPQHYRLPLPSWITRLISSEIEPTRPLPASMLKAEFASLPARIKGHTVAIPLSGDGNAIWVVKLMSQTLEDRSTNRHWRPQARSIMAMTEL